MLEQFCSKNLIEKTRYAVDYHGMTWEIDEFEGANAGLVVGEVELDSPTQEFALPPWVIREVSMDHRYYNSMLSQNPWNSWKDDEK